MYTQFLSFPYWIVCLVIIYSVSLWNYTHKKKVGHMTVCKHWQVYKINAVEHQIKIYGQLRQCILISGSIRSTRSFVWIDLFYKKKKRIKTKAWKGESLFLSIHWISYCFTPHDLLTLIHAYVYRIVIHSLNDIQLIKLQFFKKKQQEETIQFKIQSYFSFI
jgi:hypothetical protein